MGFASQFNLGARVTERLQRTFDWDPGMELGHPLTNDDYVSVSRLFEEHNYDESVVIPIRGVVYNRNTNNEYGASSSAALEDGRMVSLPKHQNDAILSMLNSPDAIDAIRHGELGFTMSAYESHGKDCVGIRWVDIE